VDTLGRMSTTLAERRRAARASSFARSSSTVSTLVAFVVVFVAALAIGLLQGERPFYGDSGAYWELAELFGREGHFSLLNFDSPLRGYALPLTLYGVQSLAADVQLAAWSAAVLFNVVLYALIGVVLGPLLAEAIWPERHWNVWRRIALAAALLVFWGGDLNYPLTDVPGLAMALLALVAIARVDAPAWMFLAGLAGALALDLRPAYVPFVPMLLVVIVLSWFEQRGRPHASAARRALCVTLLLAGFVLASLPQSLVTHRYYKSWSFIPGSVLNLELVKLTEGMEDQRFDSYFGIAGGAKLVYPDATTERLLEEQPGAKITSFGQYLGLIASHPQIMIPMFARRLIDGLDTRYNTVYVEHLDGEGRLWLRLAGFLFVFLALARVLWPRARRQLGRARWRYAIALLLCSASSVTTNVETRFMLPICLLSYVVALAPGWPNPIEEGAAGVRRYRTLAVLGLAYVVFMLLIWHVVSAAVGQLSVSGS
jgi:hypothetical protein